MYINMQKSQLGLHMNQGVWEFKYLALSPVFWFPTVPCDVKVELQPGYMLQLLLQKINQNVIRSKNIQTGRKLSWTASIPLLRKNQLP
jgi:hypothetical protein